jgi:hypothetical protein
VAAHLIRHHGREQGCDLDGMPINPIYRVEVVDSDGHSHAFCCLRCAEIWVSRQAVAPRSVLLTDEPSGTMVSACEACFVRSSVVTSPATDDRVHAFRSRAEAEKHAETFGGTVLSGSDRPFH